MTDRAQAFTIEALVASLLILGSLLFTFQVAGVTSLSPTTSNQQVGNQLDGIATGTLDSAAANDSLGSTIRYWNDSSGQFHDAADDETYYVAERPPTALGELLNRRLAVRGIAYNVNVQYVTANGSVRDQRLVRYGAPTDDAVRATTTVTLYDNDSLYDSQEVSTSVTLDEASSFYAPDAAPDSRVYNTVRVEVVAWQI